MKKTGFLSFGHWTAVPGSQARTTSDVRLQSIDLAVAAEQLGADGAFFRVRHFARQLASPFPLLAAVSTRTSGIEIGAAVIDMRYENPLYTAEDAGAANIIAGGRLQLGISRGSPARRGFLRLATGQGLCAAELTPDVPKPTGPAAPRTLLRGAARADLVGVWIQRNRGLGSEARHEPAMFHAEGR
jgi:Luciferase-like monooxygenase